MFFRKLHTHTGIFKYIISAHSSEKFKAYCISSIYLQYTDVCRSSEENHFRRGLRARRPTTSLIELLSKTTTTTTQRLAGYIYIHKSRVPPSAITYTSPNFRIMEAYSSSYRVLKSNCLNYRKLSRQRLLLLQSAVDLYKESWRRRTICPN